MSGQSTWVRQQKSSQTAAGSQLGLCVNWITYWQGPGVFLYHTGSSLNTSSNKYSYRTGPTTTHFSLLTVQIAGYLSIFLLFIYVPGDNLQFDAPLLISPKIQIPNGNKKKLLQWINLLQAISPLFKAMRKQLRLLLPWCRRSTSKVGRGQVQSPPKLPLPNWDKLALVTLSGGNLMQLAKRLYLLQPTWRL